METKKICYKCLIEELDNAKLTETVKRMIEDIAPENRTPLGEYNRRLEICKNCNSLISGTCVKCGCYVELRAAGKKQRCPDQGNKWELKIL